MEAQETASTLSDILQTSLSSGNYSLALSTVTDNACSNKIQENPWEIIPLITQHITHNVEQSNPELFETCERLLEVVTDKAYPDDVILLLIKDIEIAPDEVAFLTLIKPLQKCLTLLPKKRLNYLAWCFNAIQKYIDTLSLPQNLYLDVDEKILLDCDPQVGKITVIYMDLLVFYENLVESLRSCSNSEQTECRDLLVKYLLQLLGRPFAYLDMTCEINPKGRARRIAEKLVEYIVKLSPDVYQFLQFKHSYSEDDYIVVKNLALGVFFYLHLSEGICLEKTIKVYDSVFVFQHCLEYVVPLIEQDYQCTVEKGLKLTGSLLDKVKSQNLTYQLLDSDIHSKFCSCITNVITFNSIEDYRKQALDLFRVYLFSFETRGRYLLIANLMNQLTHKGIIGYIITIYKDMLAQEMNVATDITYFSSTKLYKLLDVFCHLPSGELTDLMDVADQVIAVLNFLRFIFIRDKENRTGIWDYFVELRLNFFDPLKSAIDISRANYQVKLKRLQEDHVKDNVRKKKSSFTVTVQGDDLPDISYNEKLAVLQSSLTGFDVMESILCRVKMLIHEGPIKQSID